MCITFTSGITLVLITPIISRYPPSGYSLTDVTGYDTSCDTVETSPLIITDCNQAGSIHNDAISVNNSLENDVIVSITSSIGCSSIFVPAGSNIDVINVVGCTYTTTCLPLPVPLQCSLNNSTANIALHCDGTYLITPSVYHFTNSDSVSIPAIITASNISFIVIIAAGDVYPPPPYGISDINNITSPCGLVCATPVLPTVITVLPSSGAFSLGYIENGSGQDIVVSLSNGTDCCAVYLASGANLCDISNATLYYAVAV